MTRMLRHHAITRCMPSYYLSMGYFLPSGCHQEVPCHPCHMHDASTATDPHFYILPELTIVIAHAPTTCRPKESDSPPVPVYPVS